MQLRPPDHSGRSYPLEAIGSGSASTDRRYRRFLLLAVCTFPRGTDDPGGACGRGASEKVLDLGRAFKLMGRQHEASDAHVAVSPICDTRHEPPYAALRGPTPGIRSPDLPRAVQRTGLSDACQRVPPGDHYVFVLTYGSDAQWVKNVIAAGGCSIRIRGHDTRPRGARTPRRPNAYGGRSAAEVRRPHRRGNRVPVHASRVGRLRICG